MTKMLKDFRASYRVSVKALITDDRGAVLMVRENGDTWDLPGGGLEHGEDPQTALAREMTEELDAQVATEDRPQAFTTWSVKFDIPVLLLVYRCELLGQPSTTADVNEFAYFRADDLADLPLDTTLQRDVLQKIIAS